MTWQVSIDHGMDVQYRTSFWDMTWKRMICHVVSATWRTNSNQAKPAVCLRACELKINDKFTCSLPITIKQFSQYDNVCFLISWRLMFPSDCDFRVITWLSLMLLVTMNGKHFRPHRKSFSFSSSLWQSVFGSSRYVATHTMTVYATFIKHFYIFFCSKKREICYFWKKSGQKECAQCRWFSLKESGNYGPCPFSRSHYLVLLKCFRTSGYGYIPKDLVKLKDLEEEP